MDELLVIDIKISNDDLNILCYGGDFLLYYEDENILCHNFIIKMDLKNYDLKYLMNNYEKYSMNIIDKDKKIIFFDYLSGDEIIIKYNKLDEINNGYENIINKKIKYLVKTYENDREEFMSIHKKIENIKNYIKNEMENINKKIDFYKNDNDNEKVLNRNIGEYEILKKILNIIK